nr:hypothetical protein Iba_chr15aCG9840 [Ipomoea batatas]
MLSEFEVSAFGLSIAILPAARWRKGIRRERQLNSSRPSRDERTRVATESLDLGSLVVVRKQNSKSKECDCKHLLFPSSLDLQDVRAFVFLLRKSSQRGHVDNADDLISRMIRAFLEKRDGGERTTGIAFREGWNLSAGKFSSVSGRGRFVEAEDKNDGVEYESWIMTAARLTKRRQKSKTPRPDAEVAYHATWRHTCQSNARNI